MNKISVIITGATGMVGEGVLHECLLHSEVEAVLSISRKPSGVTHPKLKEVIHADFFNLSAVESQLSGYNACYFCLGVSSIGVKEAEYTKMTYTLTMHVAETLSKLNKEMTFCYVSGAGTDTNGRSMWSKVKGKTEDDLFKLPFKAVFAFRPGYINPTKGLKNTLSFYKYITWMYPFFKVVFPGMVSTLKEVGLAMISVTLYGSDKRVLAVKDIIASAKKAE
ncbi:NAD dependent epimerase/dehydratase family protein [Chitinophaga sp. CF118]|uniref:NAD-dependent epimerase/dehydratase family protein n=1 Tax=Chitinophaga sp. CF118 TaxID=1884367 RepID=UPI0008DEE373|nr:NAD-dependent epimerase/dehydratase family protein [Chitinophaga sp. CF118]SFD46012.1 NAD dependent epimerase/dehydratase family protein [Chitinophaga sp. CF118]